MPDWQDIDEAQLVANARQGDEQAFAQLYEHYAPLVFRFLAANMDLALDAEDLTEEIFFKVWQALPRYREQGVPFGGYLFRVARNALTDYYRRSRRRGHELPLEDGWIPDPEANPAQIVSSRMEMQHVWHVLGKLREDYRIVLSLRFLSGLTPVETAAAMGKSPGAVRVLQHRALSALRKLLPETE